jgi:hemin uptake protein HemP
MTEAQAPSVSLLQGPPQAKMIALEDLMGSDRELQLYHDHQVYRLRLTKTNKLILTK